EGGGAVVLVALGVAAGDRQGEAGRGRGRAAARVAEAVEELEEVVGILPGGIEANEELGRAVLLGEAVEALAEEGVAGRGLGERQLGSGGLQVPVEEGGIVAVARRVDGDAGAGGAIAEAGRAVVAWDPRWRNVAVAGAVAARALRRRPGREEACDKRSAPQDVTSSWARRGGANLQQEVEPQQTERPPRDSPVEDT